MHTHTHTHTHTRPLISRYVGAVVYYAHNKADCKALKHHHILIRNTTHLQKHRGSEFFIFYSKANRIGQDSAVGTATRYGLDVPGIESRWGGEIFRTRPDLPWGLLSILYHGNRVFPGGKATGA